jgi:hypothetical protein
MDPGNTIKSSEFVGDCLLFFVFIGDAKSDAVRSGSDIISFDRVESQKLEDHTVPEESSSLKNQRGSFA